MPRAVGLLVGLAAIPALFYTWKGITGLEIMAVDIGIFQISVAAGCFVSWRLQRRRRLAGPGWTAIGLTVLVGVWAVFLLWTFRPPELPLFRDPLTKSYGLGG